MTYDVSKLERVQLLELIRLTAIKLKGKLLILSESYNYYSDNYSKEALELMEQYEPFANAVDLALSNNEFDLLDDDGLIQFVKQCFKLSDAYNLGLMITASMVDYGTLQEMKFPERIDQLNGYLKEKTWDEEEKLSITRLLTSTPEKEVILYEDAYLMQISKKSKNDKEILGAVDEIINKRANKPYKFEILADEKYQIEKRKNQYYIRTYNAFANNPKDIINTTREVVLNPMDLVKLNEEISESIIPVMFMDSTTGKEIIYDNHFMENIEWNSLSEGEKDKYFANFVKHYLPKGFLDAFGNPVHIIVLACITVLTGGLFPELEVALAGIGLTLSAIDAANSIPGIIEADKQKQAAGTTHEAKIAAKNMAYCIAHLTLSGLDIICTVAGYAKGKKTIKKAEIANFNNLSFEKKERLLSSMSNNELYEMIQNNPQSNWIIKDYDLITQENIKEIVILRKDGNLNLDWPKYAGLKLETVESIGSMKGKIYVSRSGSPEGKTIGYGNTVDSWYASNSKRAIPSSTSEVQVGVMDVGKYKKIINIINSNIDETSKINLLKKEHISERTAIELIADYEAWNGKRFEVFKENGILEGLKVINRTVDSTYGFSGKIASWSVGNLNMEGGAGQLNTVFTWQLLRDSGIVTNTSTIIIK